MLLLGSVLILMNLERTLRSAVGTGRWRIKFLVLGLGVIFGVRIYARSQALLYSGHMLALGNLETGGLLLGCLLMGAAYFRRGFGEVDVYPSRAVLHTSLTVLLTGSYLLIVGLLAQIGLFARQRLELALELLGRHSVPGAPEVLLPLVELVLPPREVLDLVELGVSLALVVTFILRVSLVLGVSLVLVVAFARECQILRSRCK
jgi:hypothetical protein